MLFASLPKRSQAPIPPQHAHTPTHPPTPNAEPKPKTPPTSSSNLLWTLTLYVLSACAAVPRGRCEVVTPTYLDMT